MARDRGVGPPGGEGGPSAEPATTTPPNARQPSSPRRQCCRNTVGRHADAWREDFAYGFRDALRLAARELNDPALWLALSRLADRYDHGPDDYQLCGGRR